MQATVLTRIIDDKKQWLQQRKQQQPLSSFKDKLTPSQRSFSKALRQAPCAFILECKKASPSKGVIRADFDPPAIANVYSKYASAISVLTDEAYFQGSFDYLKIVSDNAPQPILCKDFIIDAYQIYLARYYQADAILLMLSILDDDTYLTLRELAIELNMAVLTEVSSQAEVDRAIRLKAKIVGINNRNLHDLSIDLDRTKQFAPQFDKKTIVISESGMTNHQQIRQLAPFVSGFLIGSSLMSEDNLEIAIRKLLLGENKICGLTRSQDVIDAWQAGAVYGGFIFIKQSPRYISPQNAQMIALAVPIKRVGVFRDEAIDNLLTIAQQLQLSAVQLHGDESQDYIAQLRQSLPANCQIWKAVSIKDSLPQRNNPQVERYIFDNSSGGSGRSFNWQLLNNQNLNNVILAGGLNADNITDALKTGCIGFDFNSGLEQRPGIKDKQKIMAVFSLLKTY